MDDPYAKYRDEIRAKGMTATPFRLGIAVGHAGDDLPSPYPKGNRGDQLYRDGLEFGRLRRAKEAGRAAALEPPAQEPMTDAARDVLAERRRQVEVEGWTPERDDHEHDRGQLACAAGCYALHSALMTEGYPDAFAEKVPAPWPWSPEWWKPKDARRNLVKAGALILAEIERLDRIDKGESSPPRPICGNCDTPVPPGCKGIFVSDGDHCALNYKEGSNAN